MRGQFDKNIHIKLWNFKFNSARKNLSLIGKLKLQLKTFQRVADIRKTSNFFLKCRSECRRRSVLLSFITFEAELGLF